MRGVKMGRGRGSREGSSATMQMFEMKKKKSVDPIQGQQNGEKEIKAGLSDESLGLSSE